MAVDGAATLGGVGETPEVVLRASSDVFVEDSIILLLLDVLELVVELRGGQDAHGRERISLEEGVGWHDDERIDNGERDGCLSDVFVAPRQDPDCEVSSASLDCLYDEVVALISRLLVEMRMPVRLHVESILKLEDPDIAVARLDLPIEPETIETAEHVALDVVGPHSQVKRVAPADLSEPRRYFDPVYACNLDLGSEYRCGTYHKQFGYKTKYEHEHLLESLAVSQTVPECSSATLLDSSATLAHAGCVFDFICCTSMSAGCETCL